jgi:pyruvate,water dikinase
MHYCQWFQQIEESETGLWGIEAQALSQVSRSGASVVPGFSVSREVYREFFQQATVRSKIEAACKGLTIKKPQLFVGAAKEVRQAILKASFSPAIRKSLDSYVATLKEQLLHGDKSLNLLLQAGAYQVEGSIQDGAGLEKLLKDLFAILFGQEALFERIHQHNILVPAPFSVLAQYWQQADFSGSAQSHDPESHDDTVIVIQATHNAHPIDADLQVHDLYRIDKKSLTLLSRTLAKHWWAKVGEGKHVSPVHIGKAVQTLTDEQAIQLGRQIKMAQEVFPATMRFSWILLHKQFVITRVQPYLEPDIQPSTLTSLLVGQSGSLGIAYAPVRLVKTKADQKKVKDGDIAVVEHLSPEDFTWLAGVKGVISETGSSASVEGKLAQQMSIPAVVGASGALTSLKNGQMVTIDATHGAVYTGLTTQAYEQSLRPSQGALPVTGTKVYASVMDPHVVQAETLLHADGIGLLRGEFMLKLLGAHPEDVIRRKLGKEYSEVLAENLTQAVQAVAPRPVIYQLHDVTSANLIGLRPRAHERHEPNPTMGYRGAHRLLMEPELLQLEVDALARVAASTDNCLAVMVPMVRSVQEVEQMLRFLQGSNLATQTEIALWVKCETPALTIMMEDLCKLDIAGVCFDVPAISELIVGFDKENHQVAHHRDQADPAVLQALRYAIATCKQHGIASMLVAEMEDLRPEVVEAGVRAGVTSISVPSPMLEPIHRLVASIERRLVLESLLES